MGGRCKSINAIYDNHDNNFGKLRENQSSHYDIFTEWRSFNSENHKEEY